MKNIFSISLCTTIFPTNLYALYYYNAKYKKKNFLIKWPAQCVLALDVSLRVKVLIICN